MLFVGVGMAICGNCLIACSLTLQKFVHVSMSAAGKAVETSPLFWLALCGMIAGEIGNFAAFGFASPTVVSPLGAVAVITNAFLAVVFLRETIFLRTLLGMLLCVGGSVIVVYFAPPTVERMTVDEFVSLVRRPRALAYFASVASCVVILGALSPRFGHKVLLVNLMLCSLLGSITVLCSSIASKFLTLLASGDSTPLRSPVPYVVLPTLAATAVLQVFFLNKAMAHFASTAVVPVYYITFTLASICAGGVVIGDFWRFQRANALGFGVGVALCFAGVFLITRRPKAKRPLGVQGMGSGTIEGGGGGTGCLIEPLRTVPEEQQVQLPPAPEQLPQPQQQPPPQPPQQQPPPPPPQQPQPPSRPSSRGPSLTSRVSTLVSDTLDHSLLGMGDVEQPVDVAHVAFVSTSSLYASTPNVTPHTSPVGSQTSRSRLLEEGLVTSSDR